jgi:colanic acid/amylovoran biosynthesis protein
MKNIIIGILGAPINNENMGCVALTYSIINLFEEIAREKNISFNYYDFEGIKDNQKILEMCKNLNLKDEQIRSYNIYPIESFLGFCHRPHKVLETLKAIKECDFFIDITQGDSFSDIYGSSVFNKATNAKLLIERMGKSIIFGPQTYGPFTKGKCENKAKKTIEQADLVIARDIKSKQYLAEFCKKEVYVTTDLAFALPYEKKDEVSHKKIKVGINISGLLTKNKLESTPTNFYLKADYDFYVENLIDRLLEENYELYFIPHVKADDLAYLGEKYPDVHRIKMHKDPISVKSEISSMNIFIGARMHATIGAFSAGVATIPTAYSRKFNGLYDSLEYPYVVDLLNWDTETCLNKTMEYVKDYQVLKTAVDKGMKIVQERSDLTKKLIEDEIMKILK